MTTAAEEPVAEPDEDRIAKVSEILAKSDAFKIEGLTDDEAIEAVRRLLMCHVADAGYDPVDYVDWMQDVVATEVEEGLYDEIEEQPSLH